MPRLTSNAVLIGEQDRLAAARAFGMESIGLSFTAFTDRHGRIATLHVGELHLPQAQVILSVIRDVDAGIIDMPAARGQIQENLRVNRRPLGATPNLDKVPPARFNGLVRRLLLINGPNLNLLGNREPSLYGQVTLAAIEDGLKARAAARSTELGCFQSNAEHELVERVQALAADPVDFLILNPGAFTHTSIALRDALLAVAVPFIEVHLSNVHAREPFRRHSCFSDIAAGSIVGLGAQGYDLALTAALDRLDRPSGGD
jgi:3-dehydroquinate dehydratase-2